jgi:hypothetical protein
MVDNPVPNEIDLETFLKSAGQSFNDAQRALVPGLDTSVKMMLSNAELDLKVAVSANKQGKMSIRPISSDDLTRGGIDAGMVSTLHISFISSIGEIKQPTLDSAVAKGNTIPNLKGMLLNEAAVLLKSGGWQFKEHAASREEIAAAGKDNSGRVLRQQPEAGQTADKVTTTVNFWVDLGNYSVQEIDGIGVKIRDNLSKAGISTVGELSLADVNQVASVLKINKERAQSFVDMAGLMSSLTIMGCKDEVELIVKGAGIRSIEQLADSEPKTLYRVCKEAVSTGKVRVPREFSLTEDAVKEWIEAAKSFTGR